LAILSGSFRLLAKVIFPVALLFILAGCGGSSGNEQADTKTVPGAGFTFETPAAWTVGHGRNAVTSRNGGGALVSVTAYPLLKPYDPALFDQVAAELDRTVGKIASGAKGSVVERKTTEVADRKIRAYRFVANGFASRLGFVFEGKREWQLLCRARAEDDDPDGACKLLFDSFSVS
jgi:hypothetical protein